MTVRLITTVQRFVGVAADAKPTGVPPGSEFYATDTGILYTTGDGTNWVVKTIGAASLDAAALAALETIELGATTLAALESITADTELPAARTATDGQALVAAPDVNAGVMIYDGTNQRFWRQAPNAGAAHNGNGLGAVAVGLWDSVAGAWPQLVALRAAVDGSSGNQMIGVGGFVHNGGASPGTWDKFKGGNIFKNIAAVAVTAGTPVTIWTPTSGRKFRLLGFCVSVTVAGSVIFKYSASDTELVRTPTLLAATPFAFERMGNGSMPGAANDVLKIDVTATATVSGFVFGTED